MFARRYSKFSVIAGLDPAIHAAGLRLQMNVSLLGDAPHHGCPDQARA
jgi:hypothetical protein